MEEEATKKKAEEEKEEEEEQEPEPGVNDGSGVLRLPKIRRIKKGKTISGCKGRGQN